MKNSAHKIFVPIVCLFSILIAIFIAIKAMLWYFEKSFSGIFKEFDDDFLPDDEGDTEVEIINGDYEFSPRISSNNFETH